MTEKEAVEILIRNGASVFDNKIIDEFFTDWEMDFEERDLYDDARNYLITECNYKPAKK